MTLSMIERAARHSPMGFLRGRDEVLARGDAGGGARRHGSGSVRRYQRADRAQARMGHQLLRRAEVTASNSRAGRVASFARRCPSRKPAAPTLRTYAWSETPRHVVRLSPKFPSEDIMLRFWGGGLASPHSALLVYAAWAYVHHAPASLPARAHGHAPRPRWTDIAGPAPRRQRSRATSTIVYHAHPVLSASRRLDIVTLADYIVILQCAALADTISSGPR
jgi:hypothetical protein